jgi:ubiquinone/menaquinone biosynthesis C-methylase UbiE
MKKEVLDHYDKLADEFDSISNKYCNSRYLKDIEKEVLPSDAVLEIGCGTGRLLSKIVAKTRVGCDLSGNLLHQLKRSGFSLIQADAENLPFRDSMFDVAYCVNLLEHVPHPERVVMEGLRVLKKGGRLVLITPNGDMGLFLEVAEMLKLKAPEGPHRFLTSRRIMKILNSNGLVTTARKKFVVVPSGPRFLIRLGERLEPKHSFLGFFHLIVIEKK